MSIFFALLRQILWSNGCQIGAALAHTKQGVHRVQGLKSDGTYLKQSKPQCLSPRSSIRAWSGNAKPCLILSYYSSDFMFRFVFFLVLCFLIYNNQEQWPCLTGNWIKNLFSHWKRTKTRKRLGFLATVRPRSVQAAAIREHLPWQQKQ